ncbi:hypothetical protein RSSM_00893 [Rhodopirellula sallentina SM41]|uniref:Uncharacterized protein n=1 Tax=Rhodopirellula sallentina SM41 TaxID=1263870 RepID=M5U8N2_9BACT|nr:hypothetical protein RSSM_00893 [Rhodopirellula sallentina SM41]
MPIPTGNFRSRVSLRRDLVFYFRSVFGEWIVLKTLVLQDL